MIVLGVILSLVDYLLPVPGIIATIGWILLVIGVVLLILGQVGRPVGGLSLLVLSGQHLSKVASRGRCKSGLR